MAFENFLHRKINGGIVILAIGLVVLIIGLLPLDINATQQCPENALTMPDGSACIVGAPIGPPIWAIGAFIAGIGGSLVLFRLLKKTNHTK